MRIEGVAQGVGEVGAGTGKQHGKLTDAAQQFEAMMLQEMLKPLHSKENAWDGGDADGDKSADTLSAYGTEAVAKAISKAGGVGIAKRVIEQVSREVGDRKGTTGY